MKYKNYTLGFTFEVDDKFTEVKQDRYDAFNVQPSTLHYFIALDDEGEISEVLSITKDEPCKDDEEFKERVDFNIKTLKEYGYLLFSQEEIDADGRPVQRLIFQDTNIEQDLGLCMYFARVNNEVICSAVYILEDYDDREQSMLNMYKSIKEMD